MFKKTFVLISLFSFSFLMYFPVVKKEIDLNTEDICYYSETANKDYVKNCDKGYYCYYISSNSYPKIGICLEYKPGLKKYKEECSQDSECYFDLKCSDEKFCTVKDNELYTSQDKASKRQYYYCSDETFRVNTGLKCETKNEAMKDTCFLEINKESINSDYLKVCGAFSDNLDSVSTSYYGEIEDGKYVGDALACKSGFALYFYTNKDTKPSSSTDPMIQLCVTVKGVEEKYDSKNNKKNCVIRYTKGSNTEYIYNPDSNIMEEELLYNKNAFPDCDVIMTKIELIQDYLAKFDKLKTHCIEGKFYNEPFTCENDELRKVWYYYNNPEEYLSYKNDGEILDYLIEKAYPTPIYKVKNEAEKNEKKNSSGFLNNKYFLLFLLLAF